MKLTDTLSFLWNLSRVLVPKAMQAKSDGVISQRDKAEFVALAVQEVLAQQCGVKVKIEIEEMSESGCGIL